VSSTAARAAATTVRVRAVDGARALDRPDKVVTEEPMEIRVQGRGQEPRPLAVTMRTPGHDFELAVGFCFTEGIIGSVDDLESVAYCLAGTGVQEYNVVTVKVRHAVDLDGHERSFVANASCGLCGKTTLEQVVQRCAHVGAGPRVPVTTLAAMPTKLRDAQAVFAATGGLHAAARFTSTGELVATREDVGRHNALDKLVGHALLEGQLPLDEDVLLVSGRVSFEIVQKAAMAGITLVCAVSAPSSLAVEAATRLGQTLVGFLRGETANLYTHPERVEIVA
jgi:FdhD protein